MHEQITTEFLDICPDQYIQVYYNKDAAEHILAGNWDLF